MNRSIRATLAAGLTVVSIGAANADVFSATLDTPLTVVPVPIVVGTSTFLFTAADTGFGPGAAVSTALGGEVTTLFGTVTDFGSGDSIDQDGELYTFAAYPSATLIPFSAADDFIGFSFTLADGVHYGYTEVDGSELIGYGYESTANTSILTGATGAAIPPPPPPPVTGTVPEPTSTLLFAIGLVGLGARVRRRGRAR